MSSPGPAWPPKVTGAVPCLHAGRHIPALPDPEAPGLLGQSQPLAEGKGGGLANPSPEELGLQAHGHACRLACLKPVGWGSGLLVSPGQKAQLWSSCCVPGKWVTVKSGPLFPHLHNGRQVCSLRSLLALPPCDLRAGGQPGGEEGEGEPGRTVTIILGGLCSGREEPLCGGSVHPPPLRQQAAPPGAAGGRGGCSRPHPHSQNAPRLDWLAKCTPSPRG